MDILYWIAAIFCVLTIIEETHAAVRVEPVPCHEGFNTNRPTEVLHITSN